MSNAVFIDKDGIAMSQQTLPCIPPPELPRVGSFFPYKSLVFPKNVLKGNPEYFEVI